MKQQIILSALMFMGGAAMAQSQNVNYSVYDVDRSMITSVADATAIVNHVEEAAISNPIVVDASMLNELLTEINNQLTDLKQRLNYVMKESNMTYPYDPDENGIVSAGHEYVDLGTVINGKKVYWATCNVGAKYTDEGGLLFAWGETEGYTKSVSDGHDFSWKQYSWSQEGSTDWYKITKYTTEDGVKKGIWYNKGTFVGDGKAKLDPEDDAAHANWGGDWRMPTYAELDWLRDPNNCTWTWNNAKSGHTVTSKITSNSIFLPSSGRRYKTSIENSTDGYYWSSELSKSGCYFAYYLYFHSSVSIMNENFRCIGQSVRPVCSSSK